MEVIPTAIADVRIIVPKRHGDARGYFCETWSRGAMAAAGLDHPRDLQPHHFMHRAAPDRVVTFAELYRPLRTGELLLGTSDPRFVAAWDMATAASFEPQVRGATPSRPHAVAAE